MASERAVRARLQRAGQEHLLRFCAELAPGPRAALLAELGALEPEALREHCRRAAAACAHPPGPPPDLAARLRPLPPECVGSASRCDPETRLLWEEEGRRGGGGPGRGGPGWRRGLPNVGRQESWYLEDLACLISLWGPFSHAASDWGVGLQRPPRWCPPPGGLPSGECSVQAHTWLASSPATHLLTSGNPLAHAPFHISAPRCTLGLLASQVRQVLLEGSLLRAPTALL